MRAIGSLPDKNQALLLRDYLTRQGIECKVEDDGEPTLWIYDDGQVPQAKEILERFLANPNNPDYQQARGAADELEKRRRQLEEEARKKTKDIRTEWSQTRSPRMGPLTLILMVVSGLVALVTSLGKNTDSVSFLYITDFLIEGSYVSYSSQILSEVRHGQIWRLFTPMFLHFGILHLVFNMLWLKDLGGVIEARHGTLYFLVMVLVISGLSNVAQYLLSGPMFGGMSGVVYGLLGYLWIRGKFDPSYGFMLHPHIVMMMIGWFLLGLSGLLPGMANTVHGVGLVTGALWGYLNSHHWRRFLRR